MRSSLLFLWFIEPHSLLLNPRLSSFLLSLFSFLEDGQNRNHLQPSTHVDYKALYPWVSDDLLAETSMLTSIEDVRKHRDEEPDPKGHIFGRESDAYVSVRPCAKGEPICADDHASAGEPFFLLILHHLQADQTSLATHGVREGAPHRNLCGLYLATPQQLGLREGVRHSVQPSRAHPFGERLPPLLRGQEPREKPLGKLQRGWQGEAS